MSSMKKMKKFVKSLPIPLNHPKPSTLWFVCKFCTRAYQQAKDLIDHKKKLHFKQYQEDKERRKATKKKIQNTKLTVTTNLQRSDGKQLFIENKEISLVTAHDDVDDGEEQKSSDMKLKLMKTSLDDEVVTEKSKVQVVVDKKQEWSSGVTVICEADSNTGVFGVEKKRKFFKNPRRPRLPKPPRVIKRKRKARNHSEDPIHCSYCNKIYYSPGGLKAHQRIHTGEKPYKCHYCDECFTFPAQRIRHRRVIHERDSNWKLRFDTCVIQSQGKGQSTLPSTKELTLDQNTDKSCAETGLSESSAFMWTSMSIFVQRKSIPNGILYSCNFCDKEFPVLSAASQHVLSHIDEDQNESQEKETDEGTKIWRPFTETSSSIAMAKEKNIIPKTKICPDCGHSFSRTNNLRRHQKFCHDSK